MSSGQNACLPPSPPAARRDPSIRAHRSYLVLGACVLLAVAAWTASVWVDDGDGTCGAVYAPNLHRGGCARMLAPRTLASAVLVGLAALAASAASQRQPRVTIRSLTAAGALVAGASAFLVLNGALDRPPRQIPYDAPLPVGTFAPPTAPLTAPPTTR